MSAAPPGARTDRFLVLRRDGSLWAAPGAAVLDVERAGLRVRLRLRHGGVLDADEVAGVAQDLRVHAAGPALRSWWPERFDGLAVYEGEPCVVIDPSVPPRALSPDDGAPGGNPGQEES